MMFPNSNVQRQHFISGYFRFGSPRDRPIFGSIAEKPTLKFRFPKAACRR